MTEISLDKKFENLSNDVSKLFDRITECLTKLEPLIKDYEFIKTHLSSATKRLDNLENPDLQEPLKAFQKLRKAVAKASTVGL